MLWVFLPFYALYEAYRSITDAPPPFSAVAAKKTS
jgi:hypothetical protein